jgi:hypothetical protein
MSSLRMKRKEESKGVSLVQPKDKSFLVFWKKDSPQDKKQRITSKDIKHVFQESSFIVHVHDSFHFLHETRIIQRLRQWTSRNAEMVVDYDKTKRLIKNNLSVVLRSRLFDAGNKRHNRLIRDKKNKRAKERESPEIQSFYQGLSIITRRDSR